VSDTYRQEVCREPVYRAPPEHPAAVLVLRRITKAYLKERLKPMRGLKSVRSDAVFVVGHGLVRNIRRGFYRIT
jgi:hypothetical protein